MPDWIAVPFWGLVASAVMSLIMDGSQRMGLSRLSLSYLFGTFVTADRTWAYIWGFVTYLAGGWMFALLYWVGFSLIGWATWWLGAIVGLLHGLFLLMVMLPVLPHVHPRMASAYEGPRAQQRLEPPGLLGLNYGWRTPLITLLGQLLYGTILGAFLPLA